MAFNRVISEAITHGAPPPLQPVGSSISSTGVNVTISPTAMIHHITGVGSIQTINLPYAGFTGTMVLIPDAIFTLVTGGNIALAATGVVSRSLLVTYDGSSWYPSYV